MTTQFELKSLLSVTKENVWKLTNGSAILNPKSCLLYMLANLLRLSTKMWSTIFPHQHLFFCWLIKKELMQESEIFSYISVCDDVKDFLQVRIVFCERKTMKIERKKNHCFSTGRILNSLYLSAKIAIWVYIQMNTNES